MDGVTGGQPVSSLKDTAHLTPELEAALRCRINPVYVGTLGTESHERAAMLGEIDRLRAEVAELAQQRGDLAARVIELEEARGLLARLHLATGCVAQGSMSDGEFAFLRGARMRAGQYLRQRDEDSRPVNVAPDGQPSEQTR
jgi:hypothetical protein